MDFSSWSIGIVFAKCLLYLGYAAGIGGPFCLVLSSSNPLFVLRLCRYTLSLVCIGLITALCIFYLQVGSLSDSGLAGITDALMFNILWNSNAGSALVWQLSGFLCLLVGAIFQFRPFVTQQIANQAISQDKWIRVLTGCMLVTGATLIAISIAIVGHTAQLTTQLKFVIGLHVVCVAWWIGSLWPLFEACRILDNVAVFELMNRFSKAAAGFVGVLIVAGAILIYKLVPTWHALVQSDYGRILVVKLILVVMILLIAARHKWQLAPKLLTVPSSIHALRRSIALESVFALTIFVTTAVLTTMVGPEH